jgi:hypothetical protein
MVGVLCYAFFYAFFKYPEILHPIDRRGILRGGGREPPFLEA